MAEFCLKCWNELNDTNYPERKYILSETLEMCEECGKLTNVIVAERRFCFDFKRVKNKKRSQENNDY